MDSFLYDRDLHHEGIRAFSDKFGTAGKSSTKIFYMIVKKNTFRVTP